MGQCMSRKAAGAFAASAAAAHNRPSNMENSKSQSPGDEHIKESIKKPSSYSKGVAMSFGFKRRPSTAPSIGSNATAARRLANADFLDSNGNDEDTEPLTSHAVPSGRSTPRLAPPKKEANATTRVSRFGFRQPQVNRMNKVADMNVTPDFGGNNNNVPLKQRPTLVVAQNKPRTNIGINVDNNRNRNASKVTLPNTQIGRFTLQSTHLPRSQPVRVLDTKTAKTIANTSMKISGTYHMPEDNSSKDGSLTEDSGVGSNLGRGGDDEVDNSFPNGSRKLNLKPRNLVFINGNTFDVRDFDDSGVNEPLPKLPSAFRSVPDNNKKSPYQNTGFVREAAKEYQRRMDKDTRRKLSVTSSDGFSDNYCEDDNKTYKDQYRNKNAFTKSTHIKSFLKTRSNELKGYSSPQSSDEQEWTNGGEAMADESSFSLSSNDESKDKEQHISTTHTIVSCVLQSLSEKLPSPKHDFKNTIENIYPKFTPVIEATNINCLLDDERSPVGSLLSFSESDEILKKKINKSCSDSKEINEKLTPSTPGTPTNASNSLSLSEGKDDFLIDDEIADQPALIFEDTLTTSLNRDVHNSFSQHNSEATSTIVESTPKYRKKKLSNFEGSPLTILKKKLLRSRTVSLDTLSPCESITSDDLMMDYEYSQSSGLDDCDRLESKNNGLLLNETIVPSSVEVETKDTELLRDWSALLDSANDRSTKCASRSRFLKSRTGTPNSISDSPNSLDIRPNEKTRFSTHNSPLRYTRNSTLSYTGYDSDDSVRLDRAAHAVIKQDILSAKTMLFELRRILNEQAGEELLSRSETHNPFDNQNMMGNRLFNGFCSIDMDTSQNPSENCKIEMADLRRQVLFLQGQLEDKEKTVLALQQQMIKLGNENDMSYSAPASTVATKTSTCNAATQTERIRPISASPSLLNGSPTDGAIGSLVSVSELPRKSRAPVRVDSPSSKKRPSSKLWRNPGEPASPQQYSSATSIPRRATSRPRAAPSVSS